MFPFTYFWGGGAGNGETPMGRKGQAEIPEGLSLRKLSARPWKASYFPPLQALIRKMETFQISETPCLEKLSSQHQDMNMLK
ncbi:hypothetical protein EQV77_08235 [Halobacillus fulvus]|nr:hypothetical protein EQV77_08235 [Halobacillus fulvus]